MLAGAGVLLMVAACGSADEDGDPEDSVRELMDESAEAVEDQSHTGHNSGAGAGASGSFSAAVSPERDDATIFVACRSPESGVGTVSVNDDASYSVTCSPEGEPEDIGADISGEGPNVQVMLEDLPADAEWAIHIVETE